MNSPYFFYKRDFDATGREYALNRNIFDYTGSNNFENLQINLNGEHQTVNAALAIKTSEIAMGEIRSGLNEEKLRMALKSVSWPGRFEVFSQDSKSVILDGAHNPDAARVLRRTVEKYFPGERLTLLFGSLDDKDYETNIKVLSEIADSVVVCRVPNHRSIHPEKVADVWRKYCSSVQFVEEHEIAMNKALEISDSLLVCGSLYLVSEIRNLLTGVSEHAGRY
jgi:dihydrofolate synthase/folylpolyglutamate synthase